MERKHKYLHGTLEATIFYATPYTPPFPLSCLLAYGQPAYVTIKIDDKKVAKTILDYDRVWNQTFQILCAHPADSTIKIMLKTNCSVLGKMEIPAHKLLEETSFKDEFSPLTSEKGKLNPDLKLRFMLLFRPAIFKTSWQKILDHGGFLGLKNATFPQRSNSRVTLYQDAHHLSSFKPPPSICGTPRNLWEDVFNAIDGAKHLIYITGWSLNPDTVLVRDSTADIPNAQGVKLGNLLKRKAEEGVAVRIMLWNDETSFPIIKNPGIMRTHDEDAFAFFNNTKVICRLCPRINHKFPAIFSHHQKTITVDTRSRFSSGNREIMSFIGGLDLCDGRYDTEEHSLFRTLNTEAHANDFYQTSIPGAILQKGGPREPWHDTHACVTGEAAWDILANFEQRWSRQCDPAQLLPISRVRGVFQQPYPISMSSGRDWSVQVFRSIDHLSTTHLPNNFTVEQSIHEAYVEAIRRAENFIYIENQYFIGGCHLWETDQHCGCRNLIPIEIALKVANKIRAKERFAVYIVIPMWPEGVPVTESVQDILHWTRETMSMMYRMIGEALNESGEAGHPRDYLNFFCLANREEKISGEFIPPLSPHPTTQYWNAQHNRRFMVYVHSKLMIVDDIYILMGSANVNQRSMDGQRDTEIAIGCYQLKNDKNKVNGDIHAYRMSLWYEHTGRAEEVFHKPQNPECVRRIQEIAEEMWTIYTGQEVVDMQKIHLVTYPISVTNDGVVEDLRDTSGYFPDTKTPIKGRRSMLVPPIFTT
ncbi:Phospholipase D, C-terminal [Dillenia turbinata]|uniref:Phospholipase D n=1 Tax=Dillenia turbinata TaxID=194707 RepID=A0AAN8UK21_9MAGN